MSEKLLRPRIRLVMLFYTFPLPLTFQSFSFSFFLSVSVTFLDYLWKMSGYWSHLKRVCVCFALCTCVSGTLCNCHAFALSVTMLSRAYLTGLNPCPAWPIASSSTSVSHLLWSQELIHFFDPLSHTYRGLKTTLNPIQFRWELAYLRWSC